MTWPLPTPAEIAERQIADLRADLDIPDDVEVNEVTRAYAAAWAGSGFGLYLYQRQIADELMPDRATEWLARHASIWDVPRLQSASAIGTVRLAADGAVALPSGILLRSVAGGLYATTEPGSISGAGGTADLPVQAATGGKAGNLAAGAVLSLVSPVAGLSAQTAVVQAGGLTGGLDLEALEEWRSRILDKIREPAGAGTVADYTRWVRRVVGAGAQVAVYPHWSGLGTVGVVVALADGTAPSAAQLAAIQAVLDTERPVTAEVILLAVEPLPVAHTIRLVPDTSAVRAAVTASLEAYYALARIGAALPLSQISEAISASAGEESHELLQPAAAVVPTRRQLPGLGGITWA